MDHAQTLSFNAGAAGAGKRITELEAEVERLRGALEELKWLGENWPAFWIVMPGWALAEKYHAAVSTLRALRGEGEK
jgi:hypothetical protein